MKYLIATLATALTLSAAPAMAHGMLSGSEPTDGEVLTEAPEAVLLEFSEDLEPALSKVTVTDSTGAPVETAAPVTDEGANTLRLDLPEIAPGTYKVDWSVTSVDTHSTSGSYSFTLN